MAAFVALLVLNLFNGMIFTVDERNLYQRGRLFFVAAGVSYSYIIYAAVRALAAARRATWSGERRHRVLMAAFTLPPVIGGVIQILFFGVPLIWICTALAIFMIYLDILNRQISTDPLTGLNNKRELSKFLLRETAKDAGRAGSLALIMMDMDRFKEINDTYGHYYGDGMLVAVACVLKKSCKNTTSFLARFGGDEFCIVCPGERAHEVGDQVAAIDANIRAWNSEHSDEVPISLSIGYSMWDPNTDRSIEALYRRADQEMYRAKRTKAPAA